jgi:hypothetical protein
VPKTEDVKTRSGEPVLVMVAVSPTETRWLPGYIEFGDETTTCISIATEPAGARIIVDKSEVARRIKTDPDGKRPLRDERGIKWERQ